MATRGQKKLTKKAPLYYQEHGISLDDKTNLPSIQERRSISDILSVEQDEENRQLRVRQTAESRILEAYSDFFDMGRNRTLWKLQEKYAERAALHGEHTVPTTSYAELQKWSMKFQWMVQVEIDDAAEYIRKRAERRELTRKAKERQQRAAVAMQQIGILKLNSLIKDGKLVDAASDISVAEARKLIVEGAKMEQELYIEGGEDSFDEDPEITF